MSEGGPVAPEGRAGPHGLGLREADDHGARPSRTSWQNFLQGVPREGKEPGVSRRQGPPTDAEEIPRGQCWGSGPWTSRPLASPR